MKVWKDRGQSESPGVVTRSYSLLGNDRRTLDRRVEEIGSFFFGREILFKVVRPTRLEIKSVRKY